MAKEIKTARFGPAGRRTTQLIVGDSADIDSTMSGRTINQDFAGGTLQLPTIDESNIGMNFTFRNTAADAAGDLIIAPAATDGINGTIGEVSASGVVNKNWSLTLSSSVKGDWCKLVAVAVGEWYITGGVGVWASEA